MPTGAYRHIERGPQLPRRARHGPRGHRPSRPAHRSWPSAAASPTGEPVASVRRRPQPAVVARHDVLLPASARNGEGTAASGGRRPRAGARGPIVTALASYDEAGVLGGRRLHRVVPRLPRRRDGRSARRRRPPRERVAGGDASGRRGPRSPWHSRASPVAAADGQPERAATLLGAASRLWSDVGRRAEPSRRRRSGCGSRPVDRSATPVSRRRTNWARLGHGRGGRPRRHASPTTVASSSTRCRSRTPADGFSGTSAVDADAPGHDTQHHARQQRRHADRAAAPLLAMHRRTHRRRRSRDATASAGGAATARRPFSRRSTTSSAPARRVRWFSFVTATRRSGSPADSATSPRRRRWTSTIAPASAGSRSRSPRPSCSSWSARTGRPRRHRRALAARGHPERAGITVRQLLNHTSGLYNYVLDPDVLAPYMEGNLTQTFDPRDGVQIAAATRPAVRTRHRAPLLEHQLSPARHDRRGGDGRLHRSELVARIIEPLGLDHTSYTTSPEIAGRHIHGYIFLERGRSTSPRWNPRAVRCLGSDPVHCRRRRSLLPGVAARRTALRRPAGVDDDDRPRGHRRRAGRRNPRRRMGTRAAQGRVSVRRRLGSRLRDPRLHDGGVEQPRTVSGRSLSSSTATSSTTTNRPAKRCATSSSRRTAVRDRRLLRRAVAIRQ